MLNDEDRAFLNALYLRLYQDLYRYCYVLLGCRTEYSAEAENCVHQAFLQAAAHIGKVRKHPAPDRWLYTVSGNYARMYQRRLRIRTRLFGHRVSTDNMIGTPDSHDCYDEWLAAETISAFKEQLVTSLTKDELMTYETYYAEGCTIQETAARLHATTGMIRGAIQSIRRKARRIREQMMNEEETT